MDKYAYRFTVASLNISIIMLSAAAIVLAIQDKDPIVLAPILAPIVPTLIGLLVPPPKKTLSPDDYTRS